MHTFALSACVPYSRQCSPAGPRTPLSWEGKSAGREVGAQYAPPRRFGGPDDATQTPPRLSTPSRSDVGGTGVSRRSSSVGSGDKAFANAATSARDADASGDVTTTFQGAGRRSGNASEASSEAPSTPVRSERATTTSRAAAVDSADRWRSAANDIERASTAQAEAARR